MPQVTCPNCKAVFEYTQLPPAPVPDPIPDPTPDPIPSPSGDVWTIPTRKLNQPTPRVGNGYIWSGSENDRGRISMVHKQTIYLEVDPSIIPEAQIAVLNFKPDNQPFEVEETTVNTARQILSVVTGRGSRWIHNDVVGKSYIYKLTMGGEPDGMTYIPEFFAIIG